jgi:KDO2-lipid IV(A) lauroyltransferase
VLLGSYRHLARLAVEISRLGTLNSRNISSLVRYDEVLGLDNYLHARNKGRGVLFLTGHFSSWELLPYAHALHGHPLSFVVRPLDNHILEAFLDKIRCGSGNQTLPKRNSTRSILEVLARGESIGILIDQNVLPTEGGFVPFFGKLAATTTGLARLAMKTKAPVIPGRLQWRTAEKRYRMIFWPEIALVRTGNREQDVLTNTHLFNQALEEMIRLEPESWLWGHKRWNSRPPEDPENPYAHIK